MRPWEMNIRHVVPYVPGDQPAGDQRIRLNTNENPYEPSPRARRVLCEEQVSKLMLYPDPEAAELVNAVADYYGLEKEQVIAGNGSDEILAFCFMAFKSDSAKVYFPEHRYGF